MNEIFISYSRRNSEFIHKLVDALRKAGIDPWFDMEDLRPAVEWQKEILLAVQVSHNFIFAISPESCLSEFCQMELNHALMHNKRIIPILVVDCSMDLIPHALREINWINFRDFDRGLYQLLEALNSPIGISQGARLDSILHIETDGYYHRDIPLYRNEYLLGRNPKGRISQSGIILIPDSMVSRSHATIQLNAGRWQILDGWVDDLIPRARVHHPSKFGVWFGDEKLLPGKWQVLRHGDFIRFSPQTTVKYTEVIAKNDIVQADAKETYTGTGQENE